MGGRVDEAGEGHPDSQWYPRQDSNLRSWLRRPVLYPLSYGGVVSVYPALPAGNNRRDAGLGRYGRLEKNVATSSANSSGCSIAAKCPPRTGSE